MKQDQIPDMMRHVCMYDILSIVLHTYITLFVLCIDTFSRTLCNYKEPISLKNISILKIDNLLWLKENLNKI